MCFPYLLIEYLLVQYIQDMNTSTQDQLTEQQRRAWNKFSPGWKKWDDFVMQRLRPIGEKLLEVSELEDDYLVLDVATGTGEPGLTAATLVSSGEVVGTDLAEDMVAIANENALSRGIINYKAQVCDACALPFKDNYFDTIICRHGVMFFPNPVVGLKEFTRVLKPGGRVAVSTWSAPEKNPWATTIQGIINNMLELDPPPADQPGLFRCAKTDYLINALTESGLKEVQATEINGQAVHSSSDHYWGFMTEVAAPVAKALSNVDETIRQQIKKEVDKAVSDYTKDGKIVFNWSSWIAWGTKAKLSS